MQDTTQKEKKKKILLKTLFRLLQRHLFSNIVFLLFWIVPNHTHFPSPSRLIPNPCNPPPKKNNNNTKKPTPSPSSICIVHTFNGAQPNSQ